jgi:hypothetical protein
MILAVATLAFGLLVCWFERFLLKCSLRKTQFPLCLNDKELMMRVIATRRTMPLEIQWYLEHWNLKNTVIQRYICRKCGRELWIAPQFGDMEKSLFVGRKA